MMLCFRCATLFEAPEISANCAAFCKRYHMLHDRPEHRRRRTLSRRKELGDLFQGPYPDT